MRPTGDRGRRTASRSGRGSHISSSQWLCGRRVLHDKPYCIVTNGGLAASLVRWSLWRTPDEIMDKSQSRHFPICCELAVQFRGRL